MTDTAIWNSRLVFTTRGLARARDQAFCRVRRGCMRLNLNSAVSNFCKHDQAARIEPAGALRRDVAAPDLARWPMAFGRKKG
jgi:hypothetical protein